MQISLISTPSVTYDYKNLTVLSKDQIFELLTFLTERISKQFIMMGGLLQVIRKNKWYDPYPTFAAFCDTLTGIQYRKAMYLITIYESLVSNHIPFEEVSKLGFTKMILLASHLTESNYLDLIKWASQLKTQEIEDYLKTTVEKSKELINKIKNNEVLQPDYKETVKVIKPDISVLKTILTTASIDVIIKALQILYPDKQFALC